MLSLTDRHGAMASPLHYPDPPWLYELSCPGIGCSYLENKSGKQSWVGKSQRISKFHQHFKFYRKPVILEESDVLSLGIHTADLDSATGFPSLTVWCWVSIFWALETIPACLPSLCSVAANTILFQTYTQLNIVIHLQGMLITMLNCV